ncbi:MAG: ADP-ribose diphosphatase [SAR324 cluster bacterium]|uniref:ADP-ribose pyrophosphatase n=1 Tax=SAR324 cluster bacterium TaxID=2024889 RepID=A0A2A4T4T3_9DELT|nr:MAG: ADP-ribose diphosphatase [SAR324 cluster bacterium]
MKYEIIKNDRIFSEFFKVDRVELKHENFRDQDLSQVRRYHLNRPEAVAVILENETTGNIVLVEQFRYSSLKKSIRNGWTQEIIAGLLDEGEEPIDCARRETMEETGYQVHNLEFITTYFASVGISDELVHLFYGTVTNEDKIEDGGGLEDESEDLAIRELSFSQIMEDIRVGNIRDAKTIIGLQWLALKKLSPPS